MKHEPRGMEWRRKTKGANSGRRIRRRRDNRITVGRRDQREGLVSDVGEKFI